MTQADMITLGILAIVVAGIFLYLRRQKKNGGGCCGGCSGCPHAGACHPTKEE